MNREEKRKSWSIERFRRDADEIASRSIQCPNNQWFIVETVNGSRLCNTTAIVWSGETLTRHLHVCFNQSYRVPVLWFNWYHRDGQLVQLERVFEMTGGDAQLANVLTQGEHPDLGTAWCHLHPCRTESLLAHFDHCENPLLAWLMTCLQMLNIDLFSTNFIKFFH